MIRVYQRVMLLKTIILLSLIQTSDTGAQRQSIKFDHITTDHGLPSNSVTCILQDSKGFMWFGTFAGLVKYDGYNFKVYKNDPLDSTSISNNWVWAICEDRSGVLWIGTGGGGLNRYDREKETFKRYQYEENNPNSLSHDIVMAIYEDRSGVLWIGTEGGGLSRMNRDDRGKETFKRYQYEQNNPNSLSHEVVMAIYEDRSGILWIGTDGGGLNKFDREKETFTHWMNEKDNPNSLSYNRVMEIYEDKSGVLWIGTYGGGLNKFNRDNGTFTRYQYESESPYSLSHDRIRAICEDRSGHLWIGTYGGGVSRLNRADREKGTFRRYQKEEGDLYSLGSHLLWAIYEDRSGMIWIGTEKGGISKFNRRKEVFAHWTAEHDDPNSLNDNQIWAIYEDPDEIGDVLWIGTRDGGLNRFDREKGIFKHYMRDENNPYSLSNNYVLTICEDRSGFLWIGTYYNGLNRFDREKEVFMHYINEENNPGSLSHDRVRAVYEDRSGNLWIGTMGGLDKLNPGLHPEEKETFMHYRHENNNPNSLSNSSIRIIYEDRSGVLWIGTDGGLNKFNREKETFTRYQQEEGNPNSLSYDKVRSIYEDKSGTLWIGTRGGLNKFDRETEVFAQYTEKNGLPSDVIYGILEDDHGNLWLSTQKGLSKFNPKTEVFRNYDVNDGLQDNEFEMGAYCKSKSGEMFFGGINGFNAFFPDSVKDNLHIPPIVLTSFKKFDKVVHFGKNISQIQKIKLSYKDNFFSFEFAALDHMNPSKNQYAYKLEGFDQDWIYCGTRRYASYTNLDPGDYVFKVKGSNNDGIWNEEGASLKIIIIPPLWETLWFRISGLVVISFMILTIYQIRTHNIRERNRQLEEINVKLNEQVTERKRAEEQIKASLIEKETLLGEKEVLLKEIHHRVKNNLQVISSLLNLQSRFIKDEYAREMYKESQNRVRSMALIHEKLYQSPDLAQVEFGVYIKSLAQGLYRSYGIDPEKIDLEVNIKNVYLGINLAVPCGLIINELVSNALKHAFPPSWEGKGKVEVSLHKVGDDEIELIVYDNGVGLPESVDLLNSDSLGLRLVTLLVEDQLQGKITIDRRKGTKFQMRFKKDLS